MPLIPIRGTVKKMFRKAIPVWLPLRDGKEKLNRHLIFRETLDSLRGVTLVLAAADFYRVRVNGRFAGFGPARTAGGYARVDRYDLSSFDSPSGENELVIEVAGYSCKSLSTVRRDSFFAAELVRGEETLKYSGRDFPAWVNVRRVREVERFSVQRHFGEVYDERIAEPFGEQYRVATVPTAADVRFIPRGVPLASCEVTDSGRYLSRGAFTPGDENREGLKKRAYSFAPEKEPDYGLFTEEEIVDKPYRFVNALTSEKTDGCGDMPVRLGAGEWLMVDLEQIQSGFLRWSGEAEEESDVVLAFSELCEGETFSFRRVNMHCVIEYHLPRGKIEAESFEPYTFRHVAVFVKSGAVDLHSVGFRSFERDCSAAIHRTFRSPELNDIYSAALRSFAHNAVDLFTDCPSRERAGWLCDSFFTGRAEYFLFGNTDVEDAFLENYVLFENRGEFPRGVLPMCYPSDPHGGNKFIPQWDMWYVLEVCEYLTERRPDRDREFFRPSVFGVVDFLSGYENAMGLLENLPSWNFIEWSDANTWVQDISYPTNMLYAGLLDAVADTFDRPALHQKADRVRQKTVEMSFDGEIFCDHAKRLEDGSYVNEPHISEACQYYAILFGGVSLDDPRYAKLRDYVVNDFANFDPGERKFCPKNAFIGLYLRMNVLLNMGDCALMAKNLETFCGHMSRVTGTLWEYKDGKGSLDHGFASYVALTIPFADRLN